jgi:hypothetical protein
MSEVDRHRDRQTEKAEERGGETERETKEDGETWRDIERQKDGETTEIET